MRSMTNKLFMALLLTSVLSNLKKKKKVSYPLKFFTFNNSRVSVGLGTEISIDNEGQGKSLMYWYRGNSDNIGIRNSDSIPYVAWKFVLDFSFELTDSCLQFPTKGLVWRQVDVEIKRVYTDRTADCDRDHIDLDRNRPSKFSRGANPSQGHEISG